VVSSAFFQRKAVGVGMPGEEFGSWVGLVYFNTVYLVYLY
jgi:hypothetical protein